MRMLLLGMIGVLTASPIFAQDKAGGPTSEEVKSLLQKEPITEESWPTWRQRLVDWFKDARLQTEPAYKSAEQFVNRLADTGGRLPARYDKDSIAWYFLGNSYLYQKPQRGDALFLAESALRRAIVIQPTFARAHRNLALVLVLQVDGWAPGTANTSPRLEEAARACEEALRLDPALPLQGIDASVAQHRGQLSQAAALFEKALRSDPGNVGLAEKMAECIAFDTQAKKPSERIQPLVEQFPNDGKLAALYSFSLALDNHPRQAYEELQRARSLGVDPAKIFHSQQLIDRIEQEGKPGFMDAFAPMVLVAALLGGAFLLGWRYFRGAKPPR